MYDTQLAGGVSNDKSFDSETGIGAIGHLRVTSIQNLHAPAGDSLFVRHT